MGMPTALITNINHVSQLTNRLLADSSFKAGVLLLSDKYETSAIYYSLAYRFRKQFKFGESRGKNLAMSKEFKLKKYPLLVVLLPKDSGMVHHEIEPYNSKYDIIKYTDVSFKSDALSSWINGIAKGLLDRENKKSSFSSERDRASRRRQQRNSY